ncbi:MAG: deoxynucleoside kinase [Anaerolineae bacterium]|nr:deoxynucleoside kinase [Anaerolineae bacterium]
MTEHNFIAIEGVIGVGKTTLARLLPPYFPNASVLLEVFEENPFLADFYQNRPQYAFQTQIFFLLSRYHQQHEAVPTALQQGYLVSDYTFAKDELFAWLNLKDDELAMYGRVHAALGDKIPKPDLIVYLQADHEVVMRRIAQRDRPYERDMDPEYIRQLAAAYEAWLSNLQDTAVLVLSVNELDFLSHPDDVAYAAAQIKEMLAVQTPTRTSVDAGLSLPVDGRLPTLQSFQRQLDTISSSDTIVESNLVVLRDELAEMLTHLLKLANVTGIDLEEAYLEKMRKNISRTWPAEQKLPTNQP